MATALTILATVAVLGSAAVGGLLYAFSTFVMRGLDRTDPLDALTAMRGINEEANVNVSFLAMFFGSSVLSVSVGVLAVLQLNEPGSGWLLVGAISTVGAAVITVAFNVPLNNRLLGLDPAGLSASDAAQEWRAYMDPWTRWNHVRTVAAFVGAALMVVGVSSAV